MAALFSPDLFCNCLPMACWNLSPFMGLEAKKRKQTCWNEKNWHSLVKITLACEAFTESLWKKEADTWTRDGEVAPNDTRVRGFKDFIVTQFTECHWSAIQLLLVSKHCLSFYSRTPGWLWILSTVQFSYSDIASFKDSGSDKKKNDNEMAVPHNKLHGGNTLTDLHVREALSASDHPEVMALKPLSEGEEGKGIPQGRGAGPRGRLLVQIMSLNSPSGRRGQRVSKGSSSLPPFISARVILSMASRYCMWFHVV